MDEIDEKIVSCLKSDSRMPYTDIAEKVGVSEGTVRNRVEKLQDEEVINRFTVDIGLEGSSALVLVKISTDVDIGSVVDDLPVGLEVYEVAGDYDLILRLSRGDVRELNKSIDNIRGLEGVEETRTYTVLNSTDTWT